MWYYYFIGMVLGCPLGLYIGLKICGDWDLFVEMLREKLGKQGRVNDLGLKCPKCGSKELGGDAFPIDHNLIEHADILAEYNFCKDCGYSWFDYKEIEEAIKELHSKK